MKATGIVRRIDDLGRVVIPKEIRRTLRIREGDPLEIYTSRDGEVIFKKYSLMGGLDDFAAQLCETMSRSTGAICAVTDRDSVIAVAGGAKRELLGKGITAQLEQVMENRRIYQYDGQGPQIPVSDSSDRLMAIVAAPILSEGDLLGLVLFISPIIFLSLSRSMRSPLTCSMELCVRLPSILCVLCTEISHPARSAPGKSC